MKKGLKWVLSLSALAGIGYAAGKYFSKKNQEDADDAFDETDFSESDGVLLVDTDGDGEVDTIMVDTDGNGTYDTIMMDTTGDGACDTILADTTGDGKVDSIITNLDE